MTNYSVSKPTEELSADGTEELKPAVKSGLQLKPILRTAKRKAWLIAATAGITTLGAFITTLFDQNTYVGSFQLLVEPATTEDRLTEPSALARVGSISSEKAFGLDYPTQVQILKGRRMLADIAEEIRARYSYPEDSLFAIISQLEENLIVQRLGGKLRADQTKIIEVVYRGSDPKFVQFVLETVAKRYLKYSLEERQTNINSGVNFIDEQIPELQKRVDSLRSQQQELQKQYQLIDPATRGQELFTQFHQVSDQQTQIQNQLKELKALYSNLQKQLKLNHQDALVASDLSQNPNRLSLLGKLQEIESQIAVESTRFTEKSPNIQDLEEKRQNLLNLLDEQKQNIYNKYAASNNSQVEAFQNPVRLALIQQLIDTANQIQVLEVRNQALTDTRQKIAAQGEKFPEIVRKYNELGRNLELSSRILDQLLIQRETLRVEAAQNYIPWELVSEPLVPKNAQGHYVGYPPARNKKLLAGLVGGLALGTLAALILEKRRNVFYSLNDVKDAFSIPVLIDIPANENITSEDGKDNDPKFVKAFESLYAKLSFLYNTPSIRSIVVSSAEPQDGQSTVAVNLAKTAAAQGKKVLLVDANLANPELHNLLNLSNNKGLKDLLKERFSIDEVVQNSPENSNLFLLPAGSTSSEPTKLWTTKMQSLMQELSGKYDLIVYDPPHFLESTDISFMAAHTDGIVMVVGLAKTNQSVVKQAIEQIVSYRLPILGLVVNNLAYQNQEEEDNLGFNESYQSTQAVSSV